ncbi:MAG: helix-turn-helix domain-containing protein [Patescibacteria group bacterium]
MVLPENLGREVSDYIKNLLNKDAIVLDDQKRVLVASDTRLIDTTVKLSGDADDLTSYKVLDINGRNQLLIPLKYQTKNLAFLIIDADSEEIKNFATLIKSFSELLIQQYYENNKPILDSTDQFFSKIFTNFNYGNLPQYEAEAKLLGYDTGIKRIGIAIHLKGFWEKCLLDFDQASFERDDVIKNWKRNIEQSFNSFFTKNADLIIAYIGNDKFVVFKGVENGDEENVKKLLKKSYKSIFESLQSHRIESITSGFGNAYSGIDGLITAKRESELTLELGQKIWGDNQSYYFGDLGMLSILGDGDRDKKIHFADQLLSKLSNEELNKTLECFFQHNLNLTETADEMGIHRNTVIYRLNQITKTLEADPRIFEQAMTIKIALLIKSLFG